MSALAEDYRPIDSFPRDREDASDPDWTRRLICTANGFPKPLLANVLTALRSAPEWAGVLAHDEFGMSTMMRVVAPWDRAHGFKPRPWTSRDDLLTTEWMQHHGIPISVEIVQQAIEAAAAENAFHSVRDYLDGLRWDRTSRVETWLTRYLGVETTDYTRAVGKKFLISAVARAFRPGIKVDTMLIFEGGQGAGKSRAVATLGGAFYSDEIGDLGSKDAAMLAGAAWIIEMSELDAMSKSEATRTKAFLSRTADMYRPPYGKRVINAPRHCVFVGTTNGDGYLKDETGGRRFWPVTVGKIDIAALEADRDQLWAEALCIYRAGHSWWLDKQELIDAAQAEQSARYAGDPWDDDVRQFIATRTDVSAREVMAECLFIDIAKRSRQDEMRVSKILKTLGFERYQRRENGKQTWRYRRRE
ncbi:hypothetical protein LCGC14_0188000 [marine sediment metagenome]